MRREWTFAAAIGAIALIAAIRVATTHRVFSETLDEPVHIAAGQEWWRGDYALDTTHPPLARLLFALPLIGYPAPRTDNIVEAGNELLYHGDYEKTLARARIGNLVFLTAGVVGVAAWARRRFSRGVAIFAAAIFAGIPSVLGHAGVATTDIAVAATMTLALLALDLFLEAPTMRRGVFLGMAVGLGVLSKFSFFVYFPAAALVLLLVRRPIRARALPALVAVAVALLVVWAGYRFHFGRPANLYDDAASFVEHCCGRTLQPLARLVANTPQPAPALATGMALLILHDRQGHRTYLLGDTSNHGWWYYFPVVYFFKTPIPFHIVSLWGIGALLARRRRDGLELVLIAAAIFVVAMTSSINIGVRHILPVYAPLSIVAAFGAVAIWNRARDLFPRVVVVALMLWLFGGVAAAHPNYLAWFNEAAQPSPSRIAIDSNLDWGQDVLRLSRAVRELNIKRLHVRIVNNTRLHAHGIPAEELPPFRKVKGWVAISESELRWDEETGDYAWLTNYRPVRKIGQSIRLYYIP